VQIEQAVKTHLTNAAAVAALVSTRVYYVLARGQHITAPYVVITKVSAIRQQTHDGPAHLAESTFQITSYATTFTEAKQVAGVIQTALEAYAGNLGSAPYVVVGATTYDDEVDYLDEETGLFSVQQEFTFTHYE